LLEIEIEAQAHDALGDVLVLEKLFERLLKKLMEENNFSEQQAIAEMINISSHPTILKTINFGKYNGQEIKDIANIDTQTEDLKMNVPVHGVVLYKFTSVK
jgi:DNA polymerase III epsilon subunit-like protein